MKKTVLTFGLISGAISSLMMVVTLPFMDQIGFDRAEILGYTTLVLSFLMVYAGIRSYRDNIAGGTLTFKRAFGLGLLITLVSSEVVLQAQSREFARFKDLYQNPLFNAAITFTEPFPVGLVISLISALVLKRTKNGADTMP
jgi:hypothetical protein